LPLDFEAIKKIKNIVDVDEASNYLFSTIEPTKKLQEALQYAKEAHKHQYRKSGEPYIIHPILVAAIVSSITNDEAMAIAALLHDVVEDTEISTPEIENRLGEDVAHLVEGLTKIDSIRDSELVPSHSNEKLIVSALSFRKMLLASIADVRVLVVKLCDRLHNMLTLDALPSHKQLRIAEETLVVYSPIAHRLGISILKNMLEDLSFGYLFEEEKKEIEHYLEENYHSIEMKLAEFKKELEHLFLTHGFCSDDFEIMSRIKHKYSIYLKMQRKGIGIDEVLDLLAVRILTKDPVKCYQILGIIHLHFKPLSSRFKDYIAVPKDNGYQTLHTTVFHKTAVLEVQIRTYEMHKTAELGVAAHWKYKSAGNNIKLDWLNNLQYQNESIEDFYALIKNDLYSEDISVFSPKGDVYTLPRGAVALDFAYAIHSDIGNHAKGCLINKERKSLLSELKNGDIVRIITDSKPITYCSWIDAVKTSKAKTNMKHNCNARIKELNTLSSINILANETNQKVNTIKNWFDATKCDSQSSMPCDIEHYKHVIHKIVTDLSLETKPKLHSNVISDIEIVSATPVSDVVFDYCCHPKKGDMIVGFLEGQRVHIHHKMCDQAIKYMQEQRAMVFVKWEEQKLYSYNLIASLQNAKGALAEFLTYLSKLDIDINSIELGKEKSSYIKFCELNFDTKEADLNALRAKIEQKIKVIHLAYADDAYKS